MSGDAVSTLTQTLKISLANGLDRPHNGWSANSHADVDERSSTARGAVRGSPTHYDQCVAVGQ